MYSNLNIRICLRVENGFFNCINSIISKNLIYTLKNYSNDSIEPVIQEFPHYNYSIFNESLDMFNVLFDCSIVLDKDKFLSAKSNCIPMFSKYTYSLNKISNRIASIIKEFVNKDIKKFDFKCKLEYVSVN